MKILKTRLKTIPLWLMAIMFMAAQPVESHESLKEVEKIEEVKLYYENERLGKRTPKLRSTNSNWPQNNPSYQQIAQVVILEQPPKYILYGNLTFYL